MSEAGKTVVMCQYCHQRAAELSKPINVAIDGKSFDEVRGHLLLTTEMDDRHQAMAFRDFVPSLLEFTSAQRGRASMFKAHLRFAVELLRKIPFVGATAQVDAMQHALFKDDVARTRGHLKK